MMNMILDKNIEINKQFFSEFDTIDKVVSEIEFISRCSEIFNASKSEHCSPSQLMECLHKSWNGRNDIKEVKGIRKFENLLKHYIPSFPEPTLEESATGWCQFSADR